MIEIVLCGKKYDVQCGSFLPYYSEIFLLLLRDILPMISPASTFSVSAMSYTGLWCLQFSVRGSL